MKQPTISDELDVEKLAEVALGLLAPTIHDGARAWKSIDWGVMNLLFERGWIHDPRGQAKSVVLTEMGLELGERLLMKHFAKRDPDSRG